jgi:cytoskeleton protein RodZ
MTDTMTPSDAHAGKTAGTLLREARIAQGLHIAVMAASIKVTPRKLELLEADRYDELPDPAFTRALAKTMCRVLKIDAEPVLSRLPQAKVEGLEHVSMGLNTPFREYAGRQEPRDWSALANPVVWGTALLILGAVLVVLLPQKWLTRETSESTSVISTAASAPVQQQALPASAVPGAAPASAVAMAAAEVPASAPASRAGSASAVAMAGEPAGPAAATGGSLHLHFSAASWIQVTDGKGKVLVARTLQAGESLDLDGPLPLRVRVGNVAGTQIRFRGEPVSLPATRDNTAKLDLK